MKFVYALGGCSLLAGFALFDCSSPSPCTGASCVDASQVPGVSGGGCDSGKPASQGGCAVDDSDGFFVSLTGSDTATGAKTAPFQTINKGILAAAANAQKPNVYVCAGTYAENLVIQNAPAGVAIHGGFDCASWAPGTAPTTVAPAWQTGSTSPQFVLHVLGVAAVVEGMTLTAPDATDPGASSVVAYVDGSPGMTFRRATVTAGAASDGVTATPPAPLAAAANGNAGAFETVAPAKSCQCASDTTIGGQGGGLNDAGVQIDAAPGAPVINGDTTKGQAGIGYDIDASCFGGVGSDGIVGKAGTSTGTYGGLTSTGWMPSPGGAGTSGGTAQGGGGAAWPISGNTACGGSGACGGCGGIGGMGGSGGGGSIAVAASSSVLRVQASTIHAGKAGNGGDGSAGQAGQPGGTGGGGVCTGGNGGTGGAGGAGGGGAGGVSIGIATFATTPDVDAQSTVLSGTAGQGGHDATATQTKAIDGIAGAVHSF